MLPMFKRNGKFQQDVEKGDVYECVHDNGQFHEIAQVLSVIRDPFGIPHVRFKVSYRCANRDEDQGTRVLSLRTFSERYHTRAAA